MNKYALLIFFYFSFFINLKAEIIKKINILGNERITSETIQIYGKIELNKDYSEIDLNEVLKNLFETNFFEDVKVSITNNTLNVTVTEYPYINEIIIIGEKSNKYKDQIKKIINLKTKRPLVKFYIPKDIETIKNLYVSAGYNSSNVDIKVNEISKNTFDILIEIDRGQKTKISSISFIGNQKISNRRLREIVASEEHKFWKILTKNTNFSSNLIELDTRLLINYYKSLGFYDIKVTSKLAKLEKTGTAKLTYSVDEGKRYRINKISTKVDSVFDKKLFLPLNKIYSKYAGDYYSPFKIKKILDSLDDLIEENNLQFVEHNVQEEILEDSINITLNVFEGEKITVERINVTGNSVTNESVIRSEMLVDEGDPFSKLVLKKSVSEIRARNIFKDVKYKVSDGSKNNLKIINIDVQEQATGEISAGAGFGTNGGTFIIGVKENNWLGTGKSLGFDLEVDEESLSGTLNYNDPNYDFLGNSLNYSISSESNDRPDQGYENSIVAASIATSFEQYKDVFLSLGISASYDDLQTNSSASQALKDQQGSYKDIAANHGFLFDDRDRAFMPTSGSVFRFGQSLPVYADKSYIANSLSASKYKSINENIVGVGKFYLSTINGLGSDDVRLSKRKNLSSKRIRGFKKNKIGPVDNNDYIGGNYAAALNFEANLPKILPEDTNTDLSIFLDFGNLWGVDYDSSIDDSNKIRSSTGIVANWISPVGPMNFIFSQNITKADTDKTQGFTFSLGTTF